MKIQAILHPSLYVNQGSKETNLAYFLGMYTRQTSSKYGEVLTEDIH